MAQQTKDYGKLLKVLQIVTGLLMLAMVGVGIWLKIKYQIKATNIKNLSEMLTGGTFTVACLIVGISVVKSFALILPPAVIFSVCAYVMPNYPSALVVNLIASTLSLMIPYFLGRFTGAGMVDALTKRFKAVKKVEDFAGTNEIALTAVFKFAGLLPGDVSSLLFGAMKISFRNYMIGAFLGNLPLVIVYTLFGTLLKNVGEKPWVVAIPVVIIVVFLLISAVITKVMLKKNKERNNSSTDTKTA